jgi:FAD/FMN-containing dehydrogenase
MEQIHTSQKQARPHIIRLAEAHALANELRGTIRGEVRFDKGSRALYATDGSNYRQLPIGVVLPRDDADVVATVAACQRHDVPLLPRGGGTSLAGQCCNVAVVLDMSKYMHSIIEIDPHNKLVRVQPGVILDHLRNAAEHYHLTFGPDPATHSRCTLGGMIGNNSCGVHSVTAGIMSDNIEELEVLTYDGLRMHIGATSDEQLAESIQAGGRRGEIYAGLKSVCDTYADLIRARFPQLPRRVSGYALDQLLPENGFNVARALVGTEGTCVTVLEATMRLVKSPPVRSLLVLGYADAYRAVDHVPEILAHQPIGLEGFDARLVENIRLLMEFEGENEQEASSRAGALMAELKRSSNPPSMKMVTTREEASRIWTVRETALGATVFVPGEPYGWEGWEDAAVPPERLSGYLRALHDLFDRYDYTTALYGHLVGLEPSCVAVFRDELLNLFPHDENARRLSKQTFLLSEFLVKKASHYQLPQLQREALIQGHCHQQAIAGMETEKAILRQLGLEFEIPEAGCCGMAGSFGFEKEHYTLSMQCGQRALLPAVRKATDETLIIANGLSCQEQIAQSTNHQPLHLAQVIQLAL